MNPFSHLFVRVGLLLAAVLLALGSSPSLHGQSYAPATNFHDPVQRVFPVELARVLAWRENLASNAGIAEIRYTVDSSDSGATMWTLRWLDARGGVWGQAMIFYAASALCDGPDFYRNVTRQMLRSGKSLSFGAYVNYGLTNILNSPNTPPITYSPENINPPHPALPELNSFSGQFDSMKTLGFGLMLRFRF